MVAGGVAVREQAGWASNSPRECILTCLAPLSATLAVAHACKLGLRKGFSAVRPPVVAEDLKAKTRIDFQFPESQEFLTLSASQLESFSLEARGLWKRVFAMASSVASAIETEVGASESIVGRMQGEAKRKRDGHREMHAAQEKRACVGEGTSLTRCFPQAHSMVHADLIMSSEEPGVAARIAGQCIWAIFSRSRRGRRGCHWLHTDLPRSQARHNLEWSDGDLPRAWQAR